MGFSLFRVAPAAALLLAALPALGARARGAYVGDLSSTEKFELAALASRSGGRGVALWRQGEEALGRGDLIAAERLFRDSRAELPHLGVAARRHCEVLADMGRRDEAIAACRDAVTYGSSGRDLRAAVGALMSGTAVPSTEDFANAVVLAGGVIKGTTQGLAARCDIARKLNDGAMIKACTAALVRAAPEHFETRRALQELSSGRPIGFWVGWALAALVLLGTAGHALSRPGRGRAVGSRPFIAVGLAVLAALARTAAAVESTFPVTPDSFPIDDDDPSRLIPSMEARNKKPLEFGYFLQELLERAGKAMKAGQPLGAIKYYQAIAKAVPDNATGFSRMCAAYEAAGDRAKAIAACNEALGRKMAHLEDHVRYVRLVTQKEGALTVAELEDLDKVFAHLRAGDDVSHLTSDQMCCDLAVRLGDIAMLESCTADLVKLAPTNAQTITFQWTLAIKKQDRALAGSLLERARQAGIDDAGLRKMEAATAQLRPRWLAALTDRRLLAGLALLAAAAAVMLALSRRRAGLALGRRARAP